MNSTRSNIIQMDTPETEAAVIASNGQWSFLLKATCERLERERNEAREQIKELIYIAERAIDLAEIDYENDKFGVVSELRSGVEEIKKDKK